MGAAWQADGDAPEVVLRHPDADRTLAGVRLVPEMVLDGDLDFTHEDGRWCLAVPPTPAWRMEYRLELRHPDGRVELVCDPENPLRTGGAFGDRSVLEFPGYREPAWLSAPAAEGTRRDLAVPAEALDADVPVSVWSPDREARGIVLAHDGPEYERRARLNRYGAALLAAGDLPPYHLVLLAPAERDEWYSANPAYTRALVDDVLPALAAEFGPLPVVGMGASLGALALLAAARAHPSAFAGLFLQSGSFFQDRFDAQESGYRRYGRVVRFVEELRGSTASTGPASGGPVPVALTCGLVEENLANNRDMAGTLRRLGHPVTLREVPDGHNFTAWRDALHPALTDLLRAVWPDVDAAAGTGGRAAGDAGA